MFHMTHRKLQPGKLVIASHNAGKVREIRALLALFGIEPISAGELGLPEPEETGTSFAENALLKAHASAQGSGLPALADDAGLCVDAFDGLPGVQTAHYATQFGYPKGDAGNVRALLEQLDGVAQRRAALVSTLVAVRTPQDPEPLIAVGRAVGEITTAPKGTHGFGFDPVMWLPEFEKTFAELPTDVKNANSHRGKAAQQMLALMQSHWFA